MSIGNNISYLRRQKRLTQEQLADTLGVTRQTVSRWESDEVTPELDRLCAMCGLFSCKLDALVREDLPAQSAIYSEVTVKRVEAFRFAAYMVISPDPEGDALDYMARWAEAAGVKAVCPAFKLIGWDFPYVTQEQKNRFGLHGYAAACVLPEGFSTDHPGAVIAENKAADYACITIREPFIQPFERIPNAYRLLQDYLQSHEYGEGGRENILDCFEHEYRKNGVTCMDVYMSVHETARDSAFDLFMKR